MVQFAQSTFCIPAFAGPWCRIACNLNRTQFPCTRVCQLNPNIDFCRAAAATPPAGAATPPAVIPPPAIPPPAIPPPAVPPPPPPGGK